MSIHPHASQQKYVNTNKGLLLAFVLKHLVNIGLGEKVSIAYF